MPAPLTDHQRQSLEHIRNHLGVHGRPPTVREVADAFAFQSPNGVRCHLEALARKGYIERDAFTSRGIRLNPAALPTAGDNGLDLSQELRRRDEEIAALRRRLEDGEKAQEALVVRKGRAEGLAAAVRQAVTRLETFLALEVERQPAKVEGLEAALRGLREHLVPVLGDEAARTAAAVLEAAIPHTERCRSGGRSGVCRLCDAVVAYRLTRVEDG